ncbi:hypothetical protein NVP1178O_14 [Vibrio phage 1.178.O._10N.286.45.E12]|nr:hypothetical protein NVP1178O_14 [Vibrio phage 1.178.O._10N.286.45.E12]
MEKLIKDGMVAVLYSRGYGAGWYSWNLDVNECLFCPQIVGLVLANGDCDEMDRNVAKRIEEIANSNWGVNFYHGGASQLVVGWVKAGNQFEIKEYDGNESLIDLGESQYLTA